MWVSECLATVGVFVGGTVDECAWSGSVGLGLVLPGSLCGAVSPVGGVGVEGRGLVGSGWVNGTLLGPEGSGAGAPDGVCGAGCLVVVWLLDSGREHLCSCLFDSSRPSGSPA